MTAMKLAIKLAMRIIVIIHKLIANGIQRGAKTHHQDHAI
jgi:hypothetical protein